jgi:hypothetical protein
MTGRFVPRHKGDENVSPAAAESQAVSREKRRRRRPVRTTVPVATNILPEMLERAKADVERAGFRSLRAYLEALIAQGLTAEQDVTASAPDGQTLTLAAAYPSSAWAIGPTVLIHRTVAALGALAERIRAGEDVESLRVDLMSLRWEIGQHLLALRADYDREVAGRDARHYARFGTADD